MSALISDVEPDDQTNLHRHARHNAQEAIALAKQRAQEFDVQAALERKTNEALKFVKMQAHFRENETSGSSGTPGAPLVDREFCHNSGCATPYDIVRSGLGRT